MAQSTIIKLHFLDRKIVHVNIVSDVLKCLYERPKYCVVGDMPKTNKILLNIHMFLTTEDIQENIDQ